jgi:hypothetical protein
MSIGSVSLSYTLNDFKVRKTFDTRVNIKTELEYLRFGSGYESQGLGLSFISSPGISPDKNILLIDRSSEFSRNSGDSEEEEEYLSDDILIDYAGFDITDVVKEVSGEIVPLYFWHDLTHAPSINNLEILDGKKEIVSRNLWSYYDETSVVGEDRRGIYTNLKCNVSEEDNTFEVFYIRYKDLDTNLVVEELLDSKTFYEQASFVENRQSREYVITQINNNYNLRIVFDSLNYSPTGLVGSQRFWLKRRAQSKITLQKPGILSAVERWSMQITPGEFFEAGRKYWVPEYYLQLFSPTFPFRLVKEKEATIINNKLIYLGTHPIADLGTSGYYIYITIKETNGTVSKVFTNDPDADTYITKQGFVTNIFYDKEAIESISANSGFILLNEEIPDGDKAYVTCRYIERYYSYDYLSVNPSINQEILGKKIVFFIKPDQDERGVNHLIIDSDDNIIESSDPDHPAVNMSYNDWENFSISSEYFIIGDVFVVQSLSIPDISVLDTRVMGGGVSEKDLESALKLQNEVSWYWDVGNWDGKAYPGMGAIVVNLPRYILKELGGEFERGQIEEIVKRHAASGSYIIIKYYDETTEILDIIPGDRTASVSWQLINAGSYNVYVGSSPDNLSLYSTEPGTRTSVFLENLDNDKIYYIQIAPIVGNIERLPSRTLGFMPFNYSTTLPSIKYGEGKYSEGSYE